MIIMAFKKYVEIIPIKVVMRQFLLEISFKENVTY